MRINNSRDGRIAVSLGLEREIMPAALAKVSTQECSNPGASAFRDRNNDDIAARKLACAAAEIPTRPKHFRIMKQAFYRVQSRAPRFAKHLIGNYLSSIKMGAHWLRLVVGSAGGMSRMVRWPRKKPNQNK